MVHFKPARISIFILLVIILVYSTNIFNNAYAPPFGGAHPNIRPPEFKSPEIKVNPEFKSPEINPDKILKSTIKTEQLVQPRDSPATRTEKINEIFHLLDINTQSLNKELKEGIWRDAFTFANTVVIPVMDKVVAKFLLELLHVHF